MATFAQLTVWIVVGLLAGSLTSRLITWDRSGFGRARNLGLGLAGALIGGLLFRLFGWWQGLDLITISLRDIVAAIVGSFVVLGLLCLYNRFGRGTAERL